MDFAQKSSKFAPLSVNPFLINLAEISVGLGLVLWNKIKEQVRVRSSVPYTQAMTILKVAIA